MPIVRTLSLIALVWLAIAAYHILQQPPNPRPVALGGPLPAQTPLTPTPRARFTPTTRKGYYNIDVVSDFTLPASKALIFCGAGRNLHVRQDRDKLFRRGFSAVNQTHMIAEIEHWPTDNPPPGWRSSLKPSQRAVILYQNYFRDSFGLPWAANSLKASETVYKTLPGAPASRNTLHQACHELSGACVGFGDCPPTGHQSTFGHIVLDIENDPTPVFNRQEQVNLYTFMAKTIRGRISPQTKLGSIAPVPHNSYGYSRAQDYTAQPDWLWNTPARHTATSRERGMPDDILGKSFADYVDFQMPGTYYLYPEFDYSIDHTGNRSRHWLAALLGEQEVNRQLSAKPRMAWHWLFNTQNDKFNKSAKAEHPNPPTVAEGMAVFFWFTGAYGVLFWDDHIDLLPDQSTPADPARQNLGNDRIYACYEHYVHGLWRLFRHHSDLFNGRETYLNEATDCSYDGGKTWVQYNANQLKTRDLPFVRAIVNGNQILIAATKAYARPDQTTNVMVRYVQNGYLFYTSLRLTGDQIFLGRATMPRLR
ncbi:hypothetical protein [Spirosoma montaniterrae]|uniref:Uncharacterized protein n=1 Tax=Spirosoma montaniterrae TaxID=1178516 RepID=A0A1P9WW88_9BACT|nr:hypothetical protein [Spirosoma montaniterrae]AQG79646.1 hypothetical protein AWR27_10085 [Spirosoma montaniterrae]